METEKIKPASKGLPGDKLVPVDGPHGGTVLTQHSLFESDAGRSEPEEDTQPVVVVKEKEEKSPSSQKRSWLHIVADKY